jgi:hypothetical protein
MFWEINGNLEKDVALFKLKLKASDKKIQAFLIS